MSNPAQMRTVNLPPDISHNVSAVFPSHENALLHTSVADATKFMPEFVADSQEDTNRCKIVAELTSDFAYCFQVQPDGGLSVERMPDAVTRVLGYAIVDSNAQGRQSFL